MASILVIGASYVCVAVFPYEQHAVAHFDAAAAEHGGVRSTIQTNHADVVLNGGLTIGVVIVYRIRCKPPRRAKPAPKHTVGDRKRDLCRQLYFARPVHMA